VTRGATEAQIAAWRILVKVLRARYDIPLDHVYAHNWIDFKDARYCEGCALATMARQWASRGVSNRLRHPAEEARDHAGSPRALFERDLVVLGLGDAALIEIVVESEIARLGDVETLLADKHGVAVEKGADPGASGEARSFEITNSDGSSPCATIACSSCGSLRMNSGKIRRRWIAA